MTITLDLNPETEHRLLEQAQARGVSLDVFLQEVVSEQARHVAVPRPVKGKTLKLAALPLGAMSSLRRCDLYDDGD